ncbi:hypothetical protein E2509_06120, partial [Campylobacter jejuni]|nr:hypothetical protein [Campylobacter jejuni]
MAKNVVLLGGSNSVMTNGLQKGLREGIKKYNKNIPSGGELEFYNFALGASNTPQKILAICENHKILKQTNCIIIETNINDYDMFARSNFDIKNINYQVELLCKLLANLNTKIVFILLPLKVFNEKDKEKLQIINTLTKNKIFKYNFNCVDMQKYYEQRNLNDFFATNDPYHQLHSIMQKIGKNIIKNLNNFKNNSLQNNYELPKFLVKSPPEIFNLEKEFEIKELKNSLFNKKIYKLDNTIKLKFKTHFKGYTIVAIAMCHNFEKLDPFIFTSFILKNKKTKIVKRMRSSHYIVHSLNNEFIIDDESFMYFNLYNEKSTEGSVWIPANNTYKNNIFHCGLSSFLLAKFDKNRMINIDFEALINEDIEISKVYDFNHLIPSMEFYKEIINEYCVRMDPIKLAPLQKLINEKDILINSLKLQIQTLSNEKNFLQNSLNFIASKKANFEVLNLEQELNLKKLQELRLKKDLGAEFVKNITIKLQYPNSAVTRIHNHLAYKLGNAMIRNSKSFLGYIKMPYILFAIILAHKEQNANFKSIKLPPLENYPDYKEALKEKECFTY